MSILKSNIVINDPITVYTNSIRNHIRHKVNLPGFNDPNSRVNVLLNSLRDGVIKWGVENDCGEYYAFVEWNNHSKFDIPVKARHGGRLTMGDVYFLMSVIAEGLGINNLTFATNSDNEVVITSLVSKNPDEDGKLTAIFYFN